MRWSDSSAAILTAAVLSVGVGAQTGGTMVKDKMAGKMDMKDTTYTGCIEAGSAAGMFALTHMVEDHKDDGTMKDSKDKAAMSVEKDTMNGAPTTFSVKSLKMIAASCS